MRAMYIAKTIVQSERFLHAFAVAHLVEMTGRGTQALLHCHCFVEIEVDSSTRRMRDSSE